MKITEPHSGNQGGFRAPSGSGMTFFGGPEERWTHGVAKDATG